MPPAEKHILEIDSAELAFGERRILSGVYLLVETGGVTAVLGRNGCGKSCLMKILSGSLKAGFCSMRIDGKWHRRFTEKEIRYLPQHPFIPGWLRLERALGDFRLQRDFPARNPHRGAVGRGTADSGMFHHPAQPGPVHPARRAVLADCTPARCNAPNTHPAGKGLERDFAHRPHVPPRDQHCRPAVRNGRRAGLSVRKRRRPGPAGLSEPSLNGHSRR